MNYAWSCLSFLLNCNAELYKRRASDWRAGLVSPKYWRKKGFKIFHKQTFCKVANFYTSRLRLVLKLCKNLFSFTGYLLNIAYSLNLWIVHQSLNFWRVWYETFPKTTTPQEFVPGIPIFYPFQLLIALIIREYEHVEASPRCWQASPFSTSQTYLEEKDSKPTTKKYVDLSHLQKGLEASKSTRRQKLATSAEVDEHKRQLLISFWTTDDVRTLVESHSGRWWRIGAWWRASPGSPWRRGPRGALSRGLTCSD